METALSLSPAVREALAEAKSCLAERFGERLHEVRLFGSHVRGEARNDADVDVLVLLDLLDHKVDRFDILYLVAGVGADHDLLLRPVILDEPELARMRKQENALAQSLDREGVTI
jgi:uncharacterized protein